MRRLRCFTLLELMIAVTIFMLVAIALFSFSTEVSNSWSRISVQRNRFNELLVLDRAVDGILTNAIPFVWRENDSGVKTAAPFIVATPNTLRIAYMHRLNNAQEGAIRFVELEVVDGQLLATYTDRPFMHWGEIAADRRTVSVLATEVEAISFEYADWHNAPTDDWKDQMFWIDVWETEDTERLDIPLAVSMRVIWKDGREEAWVRRTMGNSFRERYGTYNLPMDN